MMRNEETGYILEKLHIRHTQYDFDCGMEEYNEYIRERAFDEIDIKNTQVYVFLTKNRDTLIGYFTLSNKSIRAEIRDTIYDQPLCLLGRMATWRVEFTGNYQITRITLTCNNSQCQYTFTDRRDGKDRRKQ